MLGRGPLIRLFLFISLVAASLDAAAEDLVQVYRDAQRYDAVYSGARYALEAGREKLPQGRSLLLPTLGLTGSVTKSRIDSESRDPATAPNLNFLRRPEVDSYTLTFSQPVFRLQNWYQFEQGAQQVRQAEAAFAQASQDLIVRVSQAYFDVLSAQDTLALVRAQKAAISEQLAQAKRNFEVGTATITDTHEAQARFDLIVAQEIAAQNDLENKRRALQALNGKEYAELAPLRADVRLPPPSPSNMQDWVDLAQKQSYPVALQEATTEVTRLEANRSLAARLQQARLRGGRAHQHRRPQRPAAALLHPARPLHGALQRDPQPAAPQGRCRQPARRRPRRSQPRPQLLIRDRPRFKCFSVAPRCASQSFFPASPIRPRRH